MRRKKHASLKSQKVFCIYVSMSVEELFMFSVVYIGSYCPLVSGTLNFLGYSVVLQHSLLQPAKDILHC